MHTIDTGTGLHDITDKSTFIPALLQKQHSSFILFAGTGKSVTGAHIAYVFTKLNKVINTPGSHKSVLYCGPSNISVDVVFSKYGPFFLFQLLYKINVMPSLHILLQKNLLNCWEQDRPWRCVS